MNDLKSLIELPKKGKALIVTDIHGNLDDFEKYMKIWESFESRDNHLILTGDFIHGVNSWNDNSIGILESLIDYAGREENFHVLLGNHEWSHVSGEDVYKNNINQKKSFDSLVQMRFFNDWEDKLNFYIDFFRKLPLAVKTKNGVFVSHSAPVKNIDSINEIINLKYDGYGIYNRRMYELLWNRYPADYNEYEIDVFLSKVGCKFSVVGHTPVDGYSVVGKQVVLSSSFGLGRKFYMELDLAKEIQGISDLVEMLREL